MQNNSGYFSYYPYVVTPDLPYIILSDLVLICKAKLWLIQIISSDSSITNYDNYGSVTGWKHCSMPENNITKMYGICVW